jgi:Glycosyl hydrolase family 9/Cellulase N-terminal ig-like domain
VQVYRAGRLSQVQSGRPPIRVNQFGYLAHRPTMITSSPAPLEFTVEDRAGAAVLTGRSDPWRDGDPDPTSGCSVHVLDMSGLPIGAGLRVRVSDQRTRHFAHDVDPAFPPPPAGALAGGPTDQDHPGFPGDPRIAGRPAQLCYLDEPTSETTNDVCIRWNAPLVWVALFLSLADTHPIRPEEIP